MVSADNPAVVVFGATGFVGRHLVGEIEDPDTLLLVSRRRQGQHGGRWVIADLLDERAVEQVVTPGCIVINLAYSRSSSGEENLTISRNLAYACRKKNVSRLVHCSTAVVVGETRTLTVSEGTECMPSTPYEITKHSIENLFLEAANDSFSVSILRPTEILGPGGQSLKKMLVELETANPVLNYMRSSISGKRQMNLVPVKDVARALMHLCRGSTPPGIYICSADDDPDNRYDRIEDIIMKAIGVSRRLRPVKLPDQLLKMLLRLRRKGTARFADRVYSPGRLFESGFQRSQTIQDAVREFVRSERTSY